MLNSISIECFNLQLESLNTALGVYTSINTNICFNVSRRISYKDIYLYSTLTVWLRVDIDFVIYMHCV